MSNLGTGHALFCTHLVTRINNSHQAAMLLAHLCLYFTLLNHVTLFCTQQTGFSYGVVCWGRLYVLQAQFPAGWFRLCVLQAQFLQAVLGFVSCKPNFYKLIRTTSVSQSEQRKGNRCMYA